MPTTQVIKFVTRTDPASPGTNKKYADAGNSEVNTVTLLNFGSLNINADTWSAVRVIWGHLTDLGGNARVNAMKFYVDGNFNNQSTISHSIRLQKTGKHLAAQEQGKLEIQYQERLTRMLNQC
jgi:hypothetical protein